MRSTHEISLLNKIRDVKQKQIDEAKETLNSLKASKRVIEARRNYYHNIAKESVSESYSSNEREHMDSLDTAHVYSMVAQGIQAGIGVAHLFPNFDVGTAGWAATPVVKVSFGGNNIGSALQAAAGVIQMVSAQYTHDATMASIKGGYERRWEEWKQQENLANKEVDQIDKQIAGS